MMSRRVLLLIAVLATSMYAALWIGIAAHWSCLMSADMWVLRRFHDLSVANAAWTTVWRTVSDVFSPAVLRVVGLIGIACALARRQWRVGVLLAAAVLPAGLVTASAKALSDRPRPQTALVHAASTSFPSGHALGIMVAVVVVSSLLWPRMTPSTRPVVVAGGAALVFLVGLSRVGLNVHHPSDVLAGWALGLLYSVLCVIVVRLSASGVIRRGTARSDDSAGDDGGAVDLLGDRR